MLQVMHFLKKGDFFVSGSVWGKVRAMINFKGQNIEIATPLSIPLTFPAIL